MWSLVSALPGAIWNLFKVAFEGLSSLLSSIWSLISSLPGTIWGLFKIAFDGISSLLSSILDFFINFFSNLLEFVKDIFIPKDNVLIDNYNSTLDYAKNKLNYADLSALNNLSSSANALAVTQDNFVASFNLMGVKMSLPVVDMSIVNSVKSIFQGWISGFIYILLAIYNYSQILWLIRGTHPIGSTPGSVNNAPSGSDLGASTPYDFYM